MLGGSDFSAAIADVDGDRQYAQVGPSALDTDRDGISDLIDVQLAVPSLAFFDGTGPGPVFTDGQVLADNGLMVTIVDAVPPDGVTAAAVGGAPGAVAQVSFCGGTWVADLTAGDVALLTCGSLTARVLSGPIEIRTPGVPAIVSVPSGTTAKLSILGTGALQVENIAGSAPIGVTIASVTTAVGPGATYVAGALPTSKDQCKAGGWMAFGRFKNQGDCVSFVATQGKNPPAR